MHARFRGVLSWAVGVPPGEPKRCKLQPSILDAFFTALAQATGNVDDDIAALLEVIADRAGFEVATLWRWWPDEDVLRCDHAWQRPGSGVGDFLEAALGTVLRPGEPVPGAVFVSGSPTWVPDVGAYPNFRRGPAAIAAGLQSGFAFPVRAHDEIVGVFELFTLEKRELDGPLFDEVAKVAARLGDVIKRLDLESQRARLLAQLDVALRRQNFLLGANRALAATRGFAETIERLAAVAVPAIGDICLIDVATKEGGIERLAAHHADRSMQSLVDELRKFPPDPAGDHPAAVVMRTGHSLVSDDMSSEFLDATTRTGQHFDLTRRLGLRSYVSAPLISAEKTIGALTFVTAGSGRVFGDEELELVRELAVQVTSVIEREQRYDEQREVAQFLQRSMLPERLEVPAGLEVVARYLASNDATEVGGDFYDLVPLDPSHIALVIGDVTGHDLVAINVMAKVRSALRAFLQMMPNPSEALSALDTFVHNQNEGRYVTVTLGILDTESGAFELASAGHPAPLLVADTVIELPCRPGVPAGVGNGHYEISRSLVPLDAGLVFYTDGLVERGAQGPDAQLGTLCEVLSAYRGGDLEAACDKVLATTLEGSLQTDDVAFLWVQRK
jgi:serine phosphatase RsbU (regulator of sigma subunit)